MGHVSSGQSRYWGKTNFQRGFFSFLVFLFKQKCLKWTILVKIKNPHSNICWPKDWSLRQEMINNQMFIKVASKILVNSKQKQNGEDYKILIFWSRFCSMWYLRHNDEHSCIHNHLVNKLCFVEKEIMFFIMHKDFRLRNLLKVTGLSSQTVIILILTNINSQFDWRWLFFLSPSPFLHFTNQWIKREWYVYSSPSWSCSLDYLMILIFIQYHLSSSCQQNCMFLLMLTIEF